MEVFNLELEETKATEKAYQLKKVCYKNGQENPNNSRDLANEFIEIGELYEKIAQSYSYGCPEQVLNFKRACSLYNAAKVRLKEDNFKGGKAVDCITQLLTNVFKPKQGSAKNTIKHQWKNYVTNIGTRVSMMRERSKEKFENMVKNINKTDTFTMMNETAQNYRKVISIISDYCFAYLEQTEFQKPSSFCHVSLGSLARQDVTPYSDFESMILLPDEGLVGDKIVYWRFYSFLFEFFLMSLNETPLRNYCIPGLNSFNDSDRNWFWDNITSPGFRSDSNMPFASKTPLGRQPTRDKNFNMELIKSVSEMVKLLKTDTARQNGYHLEDILLWSGYICGDENLHTQFVRDRPLVTPRHIFVDEGRPWNNMLRYYNDTPDGIGPKTRKLRWKLNIKNEFHRKISVFLLTVTRLSGITLPSGATVESVIHELERKEVISPSAARNLEFAIVITYLIRIKQYSTNGQSDNVYAVANYILSRNFFMDILEGKNADKFFEILAGIEEATKEMQNRPDGEEIKTYLKNVDLCSTDDEHIFVLRDRYDFLNTDLKYEAALFKKAPSIISLCAIFRQNVLHYGIVMTVYNLLNIIEQELSKTELDDCITLLKSTHPVEAVDLILQIGQILIHKPHVLKYLYDCAYLASEIPKLSIMLEDEKNFSLEEYNDLWRSIFKTANDGFPRHYLSAEVFESFGKVYAALYYNEDALNELKENLYQDTISIPMSSERISPYMADAMEEMITARLIAFDANDESTTFDVYIILCELVKLYYLV